MFRLFKRKPMNAKPRSVVIVDYENRMDLGEMLSHPFDHIIVMIGVNAVAKLNVDPNLLGVNRILEVRTISRNPSQKTNNLDFHISALVGELFALHSRKQIKISIASSDKGYDGVIKSYRRKGYDITRYSSGVFPQNIRENIDAIVEFIMNEIPKQQVPSSVSSTERLHTIFQKQPKSLRLDRSICSRLVQNQVIVRNSETRHFVVKTDADTVRKTILRGL